MDTLTMHSPWLEKARTFVTNATARGRAQTAAWRQAAALPWLHPLVQRLAPDLVEEKALALWTRPVRPARPTAPLVPELPAHAFTVDGAGEQLAAWDWGRPAPTVLLVHGWNGHAGQLAKWVAPLHAAGFHVAAFDQPGHGLSTGSRVTLLGLRDAVMAVARKLTPVHAIVAHSLGAAATALALAEGLRVDRVVLLAPPAEVELYVRRFADRLGLSPERAAGMVERVRRQVGGDLATLDVSLRAPSLTTPLLLAHDIDDREVPFAHGQAIAAAWPGAQLMQLRKLGHRRLLASNAVIERAVRFIAGAPAGVRALRYSA
jgi:pimeloyl-ACP methyl ester carboxylesterase